VEPLFREAPRGAAFDVVGLGQCSIDHVALVAAFPPYAGKVAMRGYRRLPGGQIATALLACARLGLRSAFVSSVGDDGVAEAVLAPLRAAGIDVSRVLEIPGATSQLALIVVDESSGERTVIWHRDPRLAIPRERLARADVERGRALHLDAGDPEVAIWAARTARAAGIPVFADVDTVAPGVDEVLRSVDFPIVSTQFAEARFGGAEAALRGLAALGARYPVVTLGERGAVGGSGPEPLASPAFQVEVKDTTGAGDVFHGAFVVAVLEGAGPEAALRIANGAAAMNCRALGAQGGLPTRAELESFLATAPLLNRRALPADRSGRG
jgi:sugar/nucleoside kinase (ribokinase family)